MKRTLRPTRTSGVSEGTNKMETCRSEYGRCVACRLVLPVEKLGLCHRCRKFVCLNCRTIHPQVGWVLCPECLQEETALEEPFLSDAWWQVVVENV